MSTMSTTTPSLSSSKRRLSTDSSQEYSTKRKTFDLSYLSLSEDRFTTGDHAQLDELTVRSVEAHLTTNRLQAPVLSNILKAVVKTCDRLDQAYRDEDYGMTLIGDEVHGNALAEMLLLAWSKKSFKSIRNLKYLQKENLINKPESPLFSPEDEARYKRAVSQSWTLPYEGHTDELLLQTISEMNATREDRVFSNYLPIVQSSGTGKSRTVHEMSRLVFTIPFNVRSDVENPGLTYPDSDYKIMDYLKLGSSRDASSGNLPYVRFFSSLFSVTIDRLVSLNSDRNFPSHQDLAQHWSDCFDDISWRIAFFDAVIERNKKSHRNSDSDLILSLNKASKQANEMFVELMRAQDSIVSTSGQKEKSKAVRLLLCFDEWHDPQDTTLLLERTRIVSAANKLIHQPLFILFLSAVPKLPAFPKPHYLFGELGLQAPFTELPFDVRAENEGRVKPNNLKLKDINTVEFICQFGRPLWKRLVKSIDSPRSGSIVVRVAQWKLAGQNLEEKLSEVAVLAALAVRLCIDFKPTEDGAIKEAQLITDHMRIAFSIPAHRQLMKSGYPSEPVLAEAAAQLMHRARKENVRPVEILANLVKKDIIDKGKHGELVARLILTQAYDKAVLAEAQDPLRVDYYPGVRLESFIRALFGDEKAELILESKPDNIAEGATFREAFKTARVRFTHFQRAGDATAASTSATLAAFIRGMAFQCFDNQKEVDILIPVVLKDDALSEWVMTGILIRHEVHSRRRPGMRGKVHINAENIEFFPEGEDTDRKARPYISLYMVLSVQPSARSTKVSKAEHLKAGTASTRTEQSSRSASSASLTTPHPRYSILASGCSSSIYAVVNDKEKDAYAALLASFHDHPRHNETALSAMRRLKPYWTFGPDCYDWIDEPGLSEDLFEEIEEGTGDRLVAEERIDRDRSAGS